MDGRGQGRSAAMLLLLVLSFVSLLAALEYKSGGKATQGLLSRLSLGGGRDDGGMEERLLMISGGSGGNGKGAADERAVATRQGAALIVHPDHDHKRRGKKRAALAKAGKTFFKVLGLPITTVLGGLRKLFSLATGGHRRGQQQQQQQQREGQRAIGHRPVTYVDLEALSEEQRALVEETYQDLLSRPGLLERGLAVGLVIDRECVARYFIAEKWKAPPPNKKKGGHPSMADAVARTVRWREEERVSELGADDVVRQAWNGYLYVNGTDREGRPLIYYKPAAQGAKRPEEAIRYLVYTLERALAAGRANGGVEAYSFVIDCGGFSLQTMPPLHMVKAAFRLLHHHYPTRVGFICMLYTGSAFQLLWKVLNPLVSPMTRSKIVFAPSGKEAQELLSRIEPDQLETRYGGEGTYAFDPAGYFGLGAEEAARFAQQVAGTA